MPDFESPVAVLRRTIKHQEKKRLEPDRQAALQQAAVAKHERESAEHDALIDSLIIAPSTPNSDNPLQARSGRTAKFIQKTKPKHVSKVMLARQTKGEQKNHD